MCFVHGSIDQAVAVCPMCKVFPHPRCPHQRDVCRNRTLHPRIDVSYLKNAEVDSFNGCGYCKWARTNPPPKQAGYLNPGWPGCCRPPTPADHKLIHAADWRSINIIHHVPIPPEIRAALDILRASPVPNGTIALRSPSRSSSLSARTPPKQRTASPKLPTRTGTTNTNAVSASVPTPSTIDQRRRTIDGAHASPKRNNLNLEHDPSPRRASSTRLPAAVPAVADARSSRRPSVSNTSTPTKPSPAPARPSSSSSLPTPRPAPALPSSASSASSSSSSDLSSGSLTDSTVTSDGGFTDYLSDESEAELQRQAEARAALLAQNQAEEMEFKAARLQLAHVDLRPPRAWGLGAAGASGVGRRSG